MENNIKQLKNAKVGDYFYFKNDYGKYIKKVVKVTKAQVHFSFCSLWKKDAQTVGGSNGKWGRLHFVNDLRLAEKKDFEYFAKLKKYRENLASVKNFINNMSFEKSDLLSEIWEFIKIKSEV